MRRAVGHCHHQRHPESAAAIAALVSVLGAVGVDIEVAPLAVAEPRADGVATAGLEQRAHVEGEVEDLLVVDGLSGVAVVVGHLGAVEMQLHHAHAGGVSAGGLDLPRRDVDVGAQLAAPADPRRPGPHGGGRRGVEARLLAPVGVRA